MFGRIQYREALCGYLEEALKFEAMGCSSYITLPTAYMNGFKLIGMLLRPGFGSIQTISLSIGTIP